MVILLVLVGYLVGTIPFALWLARSVAGTDVRFAGSGNVGAANVFRTTRTSLALGVMALDIAKGCAVVFFAAGLARRDGLGGGRCRSHRRAHLSRVVEVSRRQGGRDCVWRVWSTCAGRHSGRCGGVRGRRVGHALRVGGLCRRDRTAPPARVLGRGLGPGSHRRSRRGHAHRLPPSVQSRTAADGYRAAARSRHMTVCRSL